MEFLKPNKSKVIITLIIILIYVSYSLLSDAGVYFIDKSAGTKFEKAANLDLAKDFKPIIDKLESRTYEGTQFSTIFERALYTKAILSTVLLLSFSYIGACIIWNFINKRGS